MKRFLAFIIAIVFVASICSAGEFRKWGVEDIEWGYGYVDIGRWSYIYRESRIRTRDLGLRITRL